MPSHPCCAAPVASSWCAMFTATSIGTAYVVALPLTWPSTIPATEPDALTSPPPTTAGLLAASVSSRPLVVGPRSLTTSASFDDVMPLLIHGDLAPGAAAPSSQTGAP